MKICFWNKGGYDPERVHLLNSFSDSKNSSHYFSDFETCLQFVETNQPEMLFTEFSLEEKNLPSMLSAIRKVNKSILIVNKIFRLEDNSLQYLTMGFDFIFYDKDFKNMDFIIRRHRFALKEKSEKDLLLNQLEISYRELQFQKYALDQSAIVSIANKDGVITSVNQKFCDLTGYTSQEVVGKSHRILSSGYHKKSMWKEFYETLNKGQLWKGEVRNQKKDGSIIWIELTVVPFLDSSNQLYKYVAIQFDITYRMLAEQQLTHDAFYDSNTNLPNRNLFLAKIEEYIGKLHTNPLEKMAVLVLNINQFNRINNMYGFAFGDKVIYKIAKMIQKWDIGVPYFPARLGGDSFGIIMISSKLTKENLIEHTNHFQAQFDSPISIDSVEVFLHFSVGIAIWGEGGREGEEILKNAELAMFECKEDYSLNFLFFQNNMTEEIQKRVKIHSELKLAIKNSEIISYFQPIYSTLDHSLVGFESLVRWNHPTLGIVSPFYFLEVAEESGMIAPISEEVYLYSFQFLKDVFETMPFWKDRLFISLNISSYQFEESLIEHFTELTQSYSINPKLVHLEITESLAMKDFQKSLRILNAFRENGFSISLDDFGTGYSSLSYLKKFPIDHLKIDKSFVEGIAENSQDMVILESVVQLGQKLGMEIIVEGVENEEQLKIISKMQCRYVQGYYMGKPLNLEDVMILIQNNIDNKK